MFMITIGVNLIHVIKCVFVGYAPNQKGYKCYDPITRKVIVTMDFTFFESQLFFGTHLQGRNDSMDSKDSRNLTYEKQKDLGFIMIDTGDGTFGNNNLDKVKDPNLHNENKEIETIEPSLIQLMTRIGKNKGITGLHEKKLESRKRD